MKRTLVALSALLLLAASSSAFANDSDMAPSLDDLVKGSMGSSGTGIPDIRYNGLVETARTRGNGAGLAWESKNIALRLQQVGPGLDVIYNFVALMMEGNILPPVMSKAVDVYDQQSDDMINIVGVSYVKRQPARFTYVAPSWRSYLVFDDYKFDSSVAPLMSPSGDKELAVWNKALKEGYEMGVEQADQILDMNFKRLKADFQGMRLYRELLKNGLVTKPYISTGHFGITGDKDKVMNIGDSILKISVAPAFVMNEAEWKVKPDGQAAELLKAAENAANGSVPSIDPAATKGDEIVNGSKSARPQRARQTNGGSQE